MLLVTKRKLIFHQLGRVSFLKNERLCLLAREFYPEARGLQSGKVNDGPGHARPTRKMKARNRNAAQLQSACGMGAMSIGCITNFCEAPTVWMALGILREVFTRLKSGKGRQAWQKGQHEPGLKREHHKLSYRLAGAGDEAGHERDTEALTAHGALCRRSQTPTRRCQE